MCRPKRRHTGAAIPKGLQRLLKRLTVTLPQRLASELERLRLRERVSASSVAEVALRAYLEGQSKDALAQDLRAAGATLRRGRHAHDRQLRSAHAERERLEAVRRCRILDTPPDGTYDGVTALAASIFRVPVALVTIVDEDRIWFKSRFGLDGIAEIPRDPGLCSSAICSDDVYVVESARFDPRTLSNPLVAGEFGLQFYAAAPLVTTSGFRLGTLCIVDREPRELSGAEASMLETLAALVTGDLELRLQAMSAIVAERRQRSS